MRPLPAHRPRPLRIGRALLVAGATALLIAAVSSAAGLTGGGGLSSVGSIFNGSGGPASADQYAVAPTITNISPLQGTIGTTITITGTNFKTGSTEEVSSVTINGTPAASFTVDSATQISAVVASGTGASGHVTVTNTAGSDTSTQTFLFAPAIPTNTTLPGITGVQNLDGFALAFVGNAVTVSNGAWSGSPTSFTYQWLDCDSSGSSCTNIAGATSSTYTLAASDRTHTVRVAVTAHNPAGDSSPAMPVPNQLKGFVGAPNPTADDQSISGTPQVGSPLLAVNGSWGGDTPITFNYQWSQCGTTTPASAGDCSTISGATGSTYTPNSGDAGHFIGLHISGSNSSGSNGWSEFVWTSAPVIGVASITSFSPTSGGVGTPVTITGSNFTGATAVKFNVTSAPTFHVDSATQITATVPAGATTGKITVITPVGSAVSSGTFTLLALPTVSSFLPTSAPTGTANIVIKGTNFNSVSAVKFNGVSAAFTPGTSTQLTATVPDTATTGKISVTTAAGTGTSTASFVVLQQPVIDSFTPTTQKPGGTVTLFGSSFTGANTPTTTCSSCGVFLDSTRVVFTLNNDGQITATVPTTTPLGPHVWHVTNAAGTGDSSGTFTVAALSAPTIIQGSSPSPSSGPANAEFTTEVTIHGTNFTGVSSVTFGTKATSVFTIDTSNPSDNTITVDAPVGATTGPVKVTNSAGSAQTTTPFTVVAPPTIISFTPTSGRAGVTNVTISGAHFVDAAHQGALSFGSTSQPTFTVNPTGTSISAQVPNGASTGPITFTNTGIGHFTTAANFIVVQTPVITSFTPEVGKAGTVITITGQHFLGGGAPSVKFVFGGSIGTLAGTSVKVLDDSHLTVAAPALPAATPGEPTANLIVHNDMGDSAPSTDSFAYNGIPTGITFSPLHGPANAQMSTALDITGSNFTGVTSVLFGTKPAAAFTFVSDGEIMAVAPVGATTGAISVVTPAGIGKSAAMFTVDPLPTISSIAPAPPLGVNPGGSFTINGTNFKLATSPHVDSVKVNGVDVASFTINTTGTSISATLPPSGVTTGQVTVTVDGVGSATSAQSLIVRTSPTISSFSPSQGITGTKVTLTGTGFAGTGAGGLVVKFNGTTATVLQVVSDTSAVATVPTGATTGLINVSNSQGNQDSADPFVVAIKPTISSFDPTSGPASNQATTVIDIQGTHLNGTTAVMFGKLSSPLVSVNDDNDVTAVVPAGAVTGKVTLVNPAGLVISAGNFTVDGAPVVTSISPTQAAVGDQVTINGKNFIGEMDGTQFPNDTFVDFHGIFNANVESITSTQIVVDVPDGAATGPLLVTNIWGETAVSPLFTIINPPSIDDFFNEFTGDPIGHKGNPVVLFGSGFTGTTSVKFNGTSAPFTVVADWEIIATVPAGATTGPITVTNHADTATTAPSNFTIN